MNVPQRVRLIELAQMAAQPSCPYNMTQAIHVYFWVFDVPHPFDARHFNNLCGHDLLLIKSAPNRTE